MGRAFEFRKARKFKRWGQMAKVFSRIGKDIVIAIKEGGTDPDSNSKLRAAIQNARAANMPKDIVERAIKKAKDKDTSDYKEGTFEGYGPHGIAFLIETATDNNQRTVANVRSYFNKYNGSLGVSGSVSFMFDHNCQFKIKKGELDLEELELEMIDFGVEEIFEDEGNPEEDGNSEDTEKFVMLYGPFESFGKIQGALEKKGLEIISSGFERIPHNTKELTDEQMADNEKLIDKLDEDDDVMNIYHTMR